MILTQRRCRPSPVYRYYSKLLMRAVLAFACGAPLAVAGDASPGGVEFNRDIRPILSDNCFFCHGPDKNHREADLRLDVREAALAAEAIVPGQPEKSGLIERIFSDDPDQAMPPAESHKRLSARQKELFKRWIAEGAAYQTHWLYAPLERPRVPQPKAAAARQHPIDAFITERLEHCGLVPSAEADRHTLLRRLSLDLIGLPPTPAEVQAFVADASPRAYEKQVDRLLASPHFGERMAAWWLDVARFTDTVGFHGDQLQRIFPYRDYVIDAFNRNKPFDQFTLEQLAGDLLDSPTAEQLVATGFNRLNMMTREGGAQPKEYLAKYGAERVRTVGSTWLGSTMGCCECHDHKYDPFTQRDFYALQAFFADVKQWGYYADAAYARTPELRGFGNEHPFPPEVEVDSPYLQRHLADLQRALHELVSSSSGKLRADAAGRHEFEAWLAASREFLHWYPDGWCVPPVKASIRPGAKTKQQASVEATAGGVVRPLRKPAKGDSLMLELRPDVRRIAAVRVELVPDAAGAEAITPVLPRQIVRVSAAIKPAQGKQRPAAFYFADADRKETRYVKMTEIDGVATGWLTSTEHEREKQTSVWLLDPPVTLADDQSLVITLQADLQLVPVRISVSPFSARDPLQTAGEPLRSAIQAQRPSDTQRRALDEAHFLCTAWDHTAWAEYLKLQRQIVALHHGKAWTMVTAPMAPRTVRVLPRGNWQDESGPVVEPAVPHFIVGDVPEDHRQTRLDLARWLCSAENPVTPRAVVNRLWKQFFGNALSGVVDDLGAQGEPPSHPELLDWVAVEFRASGWDVKHVIKLIVMSHTYRQDSKLRREVLEADPGNRLLASQNPRRLDAEFVRDNALAIAGLLNPELGGPSVKPYQPAGYYANLQFPNREYLADTDSRQWRRGVYMHWQRTFLHPMLANFDAPAREECTANRVASNTPQQALTLLNDPTFVEAARVFAQRLLNQPGLADDARLDLAYQLALARPASSRERESQRKFLAGQREYFRAHPADAEAAVQAGIAPRANIDPVEHAAWMSVARVILNLHETITRY